MSENQTPNTPQDMTLDAAQRHAAAHGIALSPAQRAAASAAARAARAAYLDQHTESDTAASFADRFNRFYPKLLQFIGHAGDTLITTAQQLIASFGVPVALVMLLIVEHHRVYEGIVLFDANPTFASFAALALVALNLILELLIHHVEHAAGYTDATRHAASLRLWWSNMAYRLGLSAQWTPRALSPAARYKAYLRLVTFTILALALVGSMRVVIAQYDTLAWHAALVEIVTSSSLLMLLTWLGGLLFAAAAVLSAQALTRYVAIRTVEIRATMTDASTAADELRQHAAQDAADAAAAQYVYALVSQTLDKRAARDTASSGRKKTSAAQDVSTESAQDITADPFLSVAPIPTPTPAPTNGNGKH